MKVKVSIEETVVQEFEVDVPEGIEPYDFIRDEYYKCHIVLEPGECQFRQMKIHNLKENSRTKWESF